MLWSGELLSTVFRSFRLITNPFRRQLCGVNAARLEKTSGGVRQARQAACQFIFLDAVLVDGNFLLTSGGTSHVAVLDIVTADRLRSLQKYEHVRSVAVVKLGNFSSKKSKGAKFSISVNIIGPESLLDQVGDTLGNENASLEHPYALQPGLEYINAQFSHLDGRETMTHLVGIDESQSRAKKLSDDIEAILASLDTLAESSADGLDSFSRQPESILVDLTA
jgi:hypothetical protein